MPHPLTIIVGGYIVGYPLGGMTWHHLNYLLGLAQLGHEVWFLEDSGSYSQPYNPITHEIGPDPTYGIEYLKQTFSRYGLPLRWCYYSQFWDTCYGLNKTELDDLLRRADLLLCISGVTPLRPERPRPRRTAVIDTDPVFTQLRMQDDLQFADYFKSFDAAATFGTLIGTSACALPTHGIDWIGTCQPIALQHWPVVPNPSRRFTTIGKWEHQGRDVSFNGQVYHSSKAPEWLKLRSLPEKIAAGWNLELAMASMPQQIASTFTGHGWKITDAEEVSSSTEVFQQYIAQSAGELTVAKEIYAGLPSGWFSDRSSAYLASGRPVVTQESGFSQWLPTGHGLFSFATPDQAADAINAIANDYASHSLAARQIAENYFDAAKVLPTLLSKIL